MGLGERECYILIVEVLRPKTNILKWSFPVALAIGHLGSVTTSSKPQSLQYWKNQHRLAGFEMLI